MKDKIPHCIVVDYLRCPKCNNILKLKTETINEYLFNDYKIDNKGNVTNTDGDFSKVNELVDSWWECKECEEDDVTPCNPKQAQLIMDYITEEEDLTEDQLLDMLYPKSEEVKALLED